MTIALVPTSLVAAAMAALLVPLAACGAGSADARVTASPPPIVRAVAAAAAPDAAALRAEGPAGLARVLALYDAATGAERDRLADVVDRVAGQRYATASRLYWYTDLDAARAAASATGKPILSLRMLGRLDEDRSCANSRLFRVALYANAALAAYLRDAFVLHWSSEREVPRVTIDFGDGRRIETTVAGNSAHYVLDADGTVLDVIPGLVAAPVFRGIVEQAAALHARVRALPAGERAAAIAAHHRQASAAIAERWGWARDTAVAADTLALAEIRTVSKAAIELPVVRTAELGPDGARIAPDDPRWGGIGAELIADAEVLDAASRALVDRLAPTDWASPGAPLAADARAAMVDALARAIAGDTGLNVVQLRRRASEMLITRAEAGATLAFDDINLWVYDELFLTPASDPWLGMATPGTFTGLPGDGVVVARD